MAFGDPSFDSFGPAGRARAPRVRFDAISEGWSLFKAQWGTWVIVSLIVLTVNSVAMGVAKGLIPESQRPQFGEEGVNLNAHPSSLVFGAVEALINGFLYGGMFRMACLQIRGRQIRVSDLGVGDVAGQIVVGSLLAFLIVTMATSCCFFPGLVAQGVLMFVGPLIVDGRLSATEAIGRSWTVLKVQWFKATLFHLVALLVHGLGALVCGVGIFFTLPLYCLSISILYRDFFLGKASIDPTKPVSPDPYF